MESRSRNKVGNKNKKSIMKFPVQKSIKNLEIGDLFSFRNKSAVHMVVKQGNFYTEYKSYNNGKPTPSSRQTIKHLFFMKKLVILAMIGMISTFTSCKNDASEAIQKTSHAKPINKTVSKDTKEVATQNAENYAKFFIETSVTGKGPSKPPYTYTDCHTDWNELWGTSCIWSQGMLFQVSWHGAMSPGSNGTITTTYSYTTSQVSFCTCGG
jgi:hypothetical protein